MVIDSVKPKLLWISLMAPYDSVPHAGGKTENYYLKSLHSRCIFDLLLLTFIKSTEIERFDLDSYGILSRYQIRKRGTFLSEAYRGLNWLSKVNILDKYIGMVPLEIRLGVDRMCKELKREGYVPSVIILHWTEILLLKDQVKKIWPDAKIVAIEEDVSYLGQQRKYNHEKNPLAKAFFYRRWKKLKELEIDQLNNCNLCVFTSRKDYALVSSDGYYGEYIVWSPYYQSQMDRRPRRSSNDIIYYGAMNRPENWKSALWFIDHVMPLLSDLDVRLRVIGALPPKKLIRRASSKVRVEGFVEDIGAALSACLCLVAPLAFGAGIKVKVLEALSLGIPVLTNTIGIEGIPAVDGVSYYHCERAEDYAIQIRQLVVTDDGRETIESNAKRIINDNFDYYKDSEGFIDSLQLLVTDN